MESEAEIRNALQGLDAASQLSSPAIVCIEIQNGKLNLVLFTKQETVKLNTFSARKFEDLSNSIEALNEQIADVYYIHDSNYLEFSQNLYNWIIKPLEAKLTESRVDMLLFSLHGFEASSLPLAALHDGEKFLIQEYPISRIERPHDVIQMSQEVRTSQGSLEDINSVNVLLMGTSTWKDSNPEDNPELTFSTQIDWISAQWFRNYLPLREQEFSLDRIKEVLSQQPFEILHLATHASFDISKPQDSFIDLWDSQMSIDEFTNLLRENTVNLLVLSACQTTSGSGDQLGFAELANQVGVKTVLASQWQANQLAALAMMTEFHGNLMEQRIQRRVSLTGVNIARALREVQIDAIEGRIAMENRQIILDGQPREISEELVEQIGDGLPLNHPYFWATFTLVGSPVYIPSSEG
ncbi:CHAT domain-containing protein [Oscillatoriales cyanobacterium LEGE 11467]|uniref:CHAT domain-containing protein n=1 Tax=Zarconia navalis LEGE 11467 TaxID=1828826 RepID=A0A928Z6X0_9CYAN|nr:CHAT domain-containing protein [Zarconia navalis]MBE9039955.1 CHAT domain-containing protein [Zarconia navalis LEGE 11467]